MIILFLFLLFIAFQICNAIDGWVGSSDDWEPWFAWYPVKTECGDDGEGDDPVVWLKWIVRHEVKAILPMFPWSRDYQYGLCTNTYVMGTSLEKKFREMPEFKKQFQRYYQLAKEGKVIGYDSDN